jgi:hypothetical protein
VYGDIVTFQEQTKQVRRVAGFPLAEVAMAKEWDQAFFF